MEDGRDIHYHGNSVAGPRPSAKNLKRRQLSYKSTDDKIRPMDHAPKVVANSKCVWCGYVKYSEDCFFIVCPVCRSCQFCGLVSHDLNSCHLCGNEAPDEIKTTGPKRYKAVRGSPSA